MLADRLLHPLEPPLHDRRNSLNLAHSIHWVHCTPVRPPYASSSSARAEDDVHPALRLNQVAHLAHRRRKRRVLERLLHLLPPEPAYKERSAGQYEKVSQISPLENLPRSPPLLALLQSLSVPASFWNASESSPFCSASYSALLCPLRITLASSLVLVTLGSFQLLGRLLSRCLMRRWLARTLVGAESVVGGLVR